MGALNSTECSLQYWMGIKSDTEFGLINNSNARINLARETAAIHENFNNETQAIVTYYKSQGKDQDGDVDATTISLQVTQDPVRIAARDAKLTQIKLKEDIIDAEKTGMETRLNAANATIESLEKQLDKDIKDTFTFCS